MLLYEFDQTGPLITKLIAVSGQLGIDLESGKVNPDWTMDDLLNYFQKYDITLDPADLYNMIKKPPLKNLISNIQGDKIVFKGQSSAEAAPPDEENKVVKAMADKAAHKPK